jgi:hypothetical protein
MCITPPSKFFRKAVVSVSNDGYLNDGGSSKSSDDVIFVYDAPIVIKSVTPPNGPMSGNFSVMISGGPFNNTAELRCKFGLISVQAFYVDEGLIQCWAPPHPAGRFPLEVSSNDQDFTTSRFPFLYYQDPTMSRISPVCGPAVVAGTPVSVYGSGFINTTSLTCRFGLTNTRGVYVSSSYIICPSPRLDDTLSGGMSWTALSEQFNRDQDPKYNSMTFSVSDRPERLFPGAYFYPLYLSRLVTVEISNNNQDFTDSGINFLYQADAYVESVLPSSGQVNTRTAIVVKGDNFVNSTLLRCRIGEYVSVPTFLSRDLVLCFTPRIPLITYDHAYVKTRRTKSAETPHERAADTSPSGSAPNIVFVEVSNNGMDYTNNKATFTFDIKCQTGYYCPQLSSTPCPPGTLCPGEYNTNYTLCPVGTYNPLSAQSGCRRCPIGFICPDEGMQVPRICPPGFVCEFTGSVRADNPCPEGHFCLEGTATSATSCGHPDMSSDMFPTLSHAERPSTLRKSRIAQGHELYLGARNSGCWTNQTDDFGLQSSDEPEIFWMARHILPLSSESPFTPLR